MSRSELARSEPAGNGARHPRRLVAVHVFAAALGLLLLTPAVPAHAQFGALKKLKSKVTASDSSARAKDSLAQIAAGVKPESVKVERSLLKRGAAVVSDANGALEDKTGISMKDAALAASGAGAANLVAKKLGAGQTSIADQAINAATARAQQKAAGAGLVPGMSAGDAAKMQAMRGMGAMMPGGTMPSMGATSMSPGAGAFSQADAAALLAFQQEMMQVSMAAASGDAGAKSRLERWQAISLKYQMEAQKLAIAASGGDMSAAQKMQQLQLALIREWASTAKASSAKPIR